jgi:hypothetical protein
MLYPSPSSSLPVFGEGKPLRTHGYLPLGRMNRNIVCERDVPKSQENGHAAVRYGASPHGYPLQQSR